MAKNQTIARLLGETPTVPAPEAIERDVKPTYSLQPGESPSVDNLMAVWDTGEKVAVAIRVLDSLDSYQQFVELLFRIGHEGAVELGGMMDELTAEEKSAHEYDVVPAGELAAKYGKGPKPGPMTHAATGESVSAQITGQTGTMGLACPGARGVSSHQ